MKTAQLDRGPTVGRNKPCPCKSGKKFKHCCLPRVNSAREFRVVGLPPQPQRLPIPKHPPKPRSEKPLPRTYAEVRAELLGGAT